MPFQEDIKIIPLADTQVFQPIKVVHTTLPHRVVMDPITRVRDLLNGFLPNKDITPLYYAQRA
mgnify:CR=1 FL=1